MKSLDADIIRRAVAHIEPLYLNTPIARHADLDAALGCAIAAVRLIVQTLGLVIEPAGALGVAAGLSDKAGFEGRSVATILCGANISQAMLERLFAEGGSIDQA